MLWINEFSIETNSNLNKEAYFFTSSEIHIFVLIYFLFKFRLSGGAKRTCIASHASQLLLFGDRHEGTDEEVE